MTDDKIAETVRIKYMWKPNKILCFGFHCVLSCNQSDASLFPISFLNDMTLGNREASDWLQLKTLIT